MKKCKAHEYKNLIALCPNCHDLADLNKIDKKSLRIYKHNLGLLHDKYTQFEVDYLFDLFNLPPSLQKPLPEFMFYMVRRTFESGLIEIVNSEEVFNISGIALVYAYYRLTPLGKEYIDNLSKED